MAHEFGFMPRRDAVDGPRYVVRRPGGIFVYVVDSQSETVIKAYDAQSQSSEAAAHAAQLNHFKP